MKKDNRIPPECMFCQRVIRAVSYLSVDSGNYTEFAHSGCAKKRKAIA